MQQQVADSFDSLDAWVTENGWAGYDPYDIRGQGWYIAMFGSWCPGKVRTALYLLERNLPQTFLRRLLRVDKEINAKGMGLLSSAYLTRFQTTGDRTYLEKAEQILAWLSENACREYPGMSWGYPFHWQSRILIPRDTPSVVVTGTVGSAVLHHYDLTGSPSSLQILRGIAEFIMKGLNRPIDEPQQMCFSYTPLDQFTVLNASMFAAAFLARFCAYEESQEYRDAAHRAVRYVLSQQNSDGSFYYWGSEPPTAIDHFHTGFVLRFLDDVRRSLDADYITEPLTNAFNFYKERLFTDAGIPKHTPGGMYPVNIHSCAEALICLSQLGPRLGGFDGVVPVFEFSERKMKSPRGYYVYELRRNWLGEVKMDVPFMRWSQSWMLYAFAVVEQTIRKTSALNRGDACASE